MPSASPPTDKSTPAPSTRPDGASIAYSAHLHGNTDVYVIPAAGGIPRRITWHPAGSMVAGWSPDGKDVLIASMAEQLPPLPSPLPRPCRWLRPPELLPLPSGFQGSFSPDGQSLAYQPVHQVAARLEALRRRSNHPHLDRQPQNPRPRRRCPAKTPTTPTPSGSATRSISSPTAPPPARSRLPVPL